MAADTTSAPDDWKRPLDSVSYAPDDEAKDFFKRETGILDDAELQKHILRVREKAFFVSNFHDFARIIETDTIVQIFQYPCIRVFGFMR